MEGTVERLLFGTTDSDRIDATVSALCERRLGSSVIHVVFRATSVGAAFGLALADGRRVVVKVHRPEVSSVKALEAVVQVQAHLWHSGFPCPRPLLGPVALGHGYATAEELLDVGSHRDTHAPEYRRLMATALAWQLELARSCGRPAALAVGPHASGIGDLWPVPHSPIFDFAATASGAEWIDAIACRVKPLITAPAEPVIGHTDWSGKHVRFGDGDVTAVYDWDSLRLHGEATIVGIAAMTFTTHFDLVGVPRAPSPQEMGAFVDEYDAARPTRLTRAERSRISAEALYVGAYTARCEHCLDPDAEQDPLSFSAALASRAEDYLALR